MSRIGKRDTHCGVRCVPDALSSPALVMQLQHFHGYCVVQVGAEAPMVRNRRHFLFFDIFMR